MIGWNVILNAEPIEELFRGRLSSHHRLKLPASQTELNQMVSSHSSTEFFTSIDRFWRKLDLRKRLTFFQPMCMCSLQVPPMSLTVDMDDFVMLHDAQQLRIGDFVHMRF